MFRRALAPLTALYRREISRRNKRYDRGEGVVTFDVPVISVGNLSVGGTGKTPMVRRVIEILRDAGRDPCIAMRGYGSSRRADGKSDEAEEYAAEFIDLPVVAQPNRTEGLIELFGTERGARVDCVVLDDGFQHRRIARQLDIVLIDSTRDPREDTLLPGGRLREPMASLSRSHAVVITHAESAETHTVSGLSGSVAGWAPKALIAVAEHAWNVLDVLENGVTRPQPLAWLAGMRAVLTCGIGNPSAFIQQASEACGSIVHTDIRRDHDPYKPATLTRLRSACEKADVLVTTGKDWVKLHGELASGWPCPVAVPRLAMRFREGGQAFDAAVLAAAEPEGGRLDA
ncbi:MAG: tetraacyldisaccharide 4'-kinase [Planctomycetota bacterium]